MLDTPSRTVNKTEISKMNTLYNSSGEPSHKILISGSSHGRIAVVDENNQTVWELLRGDLWVEVNDADMLPNGDIIYCASKPEGACVRLISPDYANGGYNLK
jgi:hypothetical protein